MSAISITKPHDLLSAKIGKDTAQDLTHHMEDKVKEELITTSKYWLQKKILHPQKTNLPGWMLKFTTRNPSLSSGCLSSGWAR